MIGKAAETVLSQLSCIVRMVTMAHNMQIHTDCQTTYLEGQAFGLLQPDSLPTLGATYHTRVRHTTILLRKSEQI